MWHGRLWVGEPELVEVCPGLDDGPTFQVSDLERDGSCFPVNQYSAEMFFLVGRAKAVGVMVIGKLAFDVHAAGGDVKERVGE